MPSSIKADALILSPTLRQQLGVPDIPSGNSGNITIDTPNLDLFDRAEVTVSNQGTAAIGNLTINGDRLNLDRNARLTALSSSGKGGSIQLRIEDFLFLDRDSEITAATTADSMSESENIDGGNITIDTEVVTLLNNSQINANAALGNGGNIQISAQGYFVSGDSLVSASSEFGLDGNIKVETINSVRSLDSIKLPSSTIQANQQITSGCRANNDFTLIGKGGVPDNPTQNLRGRVLWQDTRIAKLAETSTDQSQSRISPKTIVEAQAWQINSAGKIKLIAIAPSHSRFDNHQCQSN